MITEGGEGMAAEAFLAEIRREAGAVDACMREDLARLAPEADPLLVEILNYGLFNGGKRIRPLLVVLAAALCGGDRGRAIYRLGCAFEYLHAATLFHDDIIDGSPTRRGKASVYHKYGTVAAILAGDFLHAFAMATVGEISGREGLAVFCRATTGMVDGEFLQLRNSTRHNLTEEEYYQAIMGKTGLLIAAACELGARSAGAKQETVRALREYGEHLGCAFQIVDDLLDYQGNGAKTGKAVGNDLAEGKVTLPLILALERLEEEERAKLRQILADPEARRSSFTEVSALIDGSDGFLRARKRAEAAVARAISALALVPGGKATPEKNLLAELARYVLAREK
jgi:octaprenyl-diphosphate synthase